MVHWYTIVFPGQMQLVFCTRVHDPAFFFYLRRRRNIEQQHGYLHNEIIVTVLFLPSLKTEIRITTIANAATSN